MKIWAMKLTNENRGEGRVEMRHTLKESKGVGDWLDINMAPMFSEQKTENKNGTHDLTIMKLLLSSARQNICSQDQLRKSI